jgi:hypothetical protein
MVKKLIRSNDHRPFDRPFFRRLRYSHVTSVSSFLAGSSTSGALQVMWAPATPRVPTLSVLWREVLVDERDHVSSTAKLRNWSVKLSVNSLKSMR